MQITETEFGAKNYLTLRQVIPISQVGDKQLYDTAGQKLGAYMTEHGLQPSGPWSVFYFTWDEQKGETDMGIGFPITGLSGTEDPEFTITIIPETKAALGVLAGDYSGLPEAHRAMGEYLKSNGLDTANLPISALEEYVVDPMSDPQPANWITNIYYFHN